MCYITTIDVDIASDSAMAIVIAIANAIFILASPLRMEFPLIFPCATSPPLVLALPLVVQWPLPLLSS